MVEWYAVCFIFHKILKIRIISDLFSIHNLDILLLLIK